MYLWLDPSFTSPLFSRKISFSQSAPELARLLGEDIDGEQTALFEHHNKTGTSNRGPGYSVQGGSHATSPDNPALAAEEELTEEDELVGANCLPWECSDTMFGWCVMLPSALSTSIQEPHWSLLQAVISIISVTSCNLMPAPAHAQLMPLPWSAQMFLSV